LHLVVSAEVNVAYISKATTNVIIRVS